MSTVNKFSRGPWPPMNDNALKVTNRFLKEYYIYGGQRWAGNSDTESPTTQWNADFFCLSLLSFQWKNYNVRCSNIFHVSCRAGSKILNYYYVAVHPRRPRLPRALSGSQRRPRGRQSRPPQAPPETRHPPLRQTPHRRFIPAQRRL